MKVRIVYVKDNEQSKAQAEQSLKSWLDYGWDAELWEGITPETLSRAVFPYWDMPGGRLSAFKENEPHKYPIKKACLYNNLQFAQDVIQYNQPMIFAEHDTLCLSEYRGFWADEFCFLAMDYAFQPPTALAKYKWRPPFEMGVNPFPRNYPLQYYRDTVYKGHNMTPGTAAYMLSPTGARKILKAVEKHGLEQSDFIINARNLKLEYISPSIVKFNTRNLNLSHQYESPSNSNTG
tara:strand:+ start:1052 stop:1756 length:705 start_codon:yes stop_codon:yes gene_type:complete